MGWSFFGSHSLSLFFAFEAWDLFAHVTSSCLYLLRSLLVTPITPSPLSVGIYG